MNKIKYMIKRLLNMNYKNFLNTVNDVHKITHKSKFIVFFDMVLSGLVYGAGYMDYQLFEMYKMNWKEKSTVVTRGKNNDLIKSFNNKEYFKFLRNKVLFNEKFAKYLNRKWFYVTDKNYDDFKSFIKDKKEIMLKPLDGTCGKSIEKIKIADYDAKKLYKYILDNHIFLIEEVAVQCKEISKLHPSSINTVRVITLKQKVVLAFLRIGSNNNVVDNFNHGGMAAPVDVETGKINYPAIDKNHNVYQVHPLTKEKIVGLKIPKWEQVKSLVENASLEIPELGYIGWDVCIGEKEPFLIEGNEFPGHDIYQLPPHRNKNEGIYPLFEKILEEEKNKENKF